MAAAARQRLEEFDSVLALEVRQRLLDIDSAAPPWLRLATPCGPRQRRAGLWPSGTESAWCTQTEVLDADVALLQAELDRTRAMAGVRFAEARLARALGR